MPESGGLKRTPHYMFGIMEHERPTINHCVFETAIGPCGLAWSARGLVAVQLPEGTADATEQRLKARTHSAGAAAPPPWVAALIGDIHRYLAGERVDFTGVAVDLSGLDPFRCKLYESMRAL